MPKKIPSQRCRELKRTAQVNANHENTQSTEYSKLQANTAPWLHARSALQWLHAYYYQISMAMITRPRTGSHQTRHNLTTPTTLNPISLTALRLNAHGAMISQQACTHSNLGQYYNSAVSETGSRTDALPPAAPESDHWERHLLSIETLAARDGWLQRYTTVRPRRAPPASQ